MATCTVSGVLQDVGENAVSGATVRANVISPFFSGTTLISPTEISTTTDASGAWSLSIEQGASCRITIEYAPNSTDSKRTLIYAAVIPSATTANFSTIAVS